MAALLNRANNCKKVMTVPENILFGYYYNGGRTVLGVIFFFNGYIESIAYQVVSDKKESVTTTNMSIATLI